MSVPQFEINFGNAKELVLPPDGNYELEVASYEIREPKKAESKDKGFNVFLQFKIVNAEELDLSDNFRVYHVIWFDVSNPWGAKPFYEAITGMELNGQEVNPLDPNLFLGEHVNAILQREPYEKRDEAGNVIETRYKMVPTAFYPV